MSKKISQLATKYLPIDNHSGQRTQKIKSITKRRVQEKRLSHDVH